MSADAKIWQDNNDDWCAVHDGDCRAGVTGHREGAYGLVALIADINACLPDAPITRWLLHVYPDGNAGLRGFMS